MSDTILLPKNRFTWALLAFQGGYVNVGGLLTVHIFVSHITGFSAHFSASLVDGEFLKSVYFLLVPLFFLLGAFFSSIFTEIRKKNQKGPVYVHILTLISALFFLITLLGVFGFFGTFGEPFNNIRDFILLSLLAFVCGSQNAIFTHYSKSIMRTTHLTGLTTDLGIGFAKFLISKDSNEYYVNKIRIDLILSFIAGSLFAAFIFPKIQYLAFLIPSVISLIVGVRLFLTAKLSS